MAAIDNAEAVPLSEQDRASAIEDSAVGVGGADIQRRSLTDTDMIAVLRAELEETRAAAESLHGRDVEAALRLQEGARLLDQLISAHARED